MDDMIRKSDYSEKEAAMDSAIIALDSYIHLGLAYIEENINSKESVHLTLLLEKMKDEINKLRPYFEVIDYVGEEN